MINPMILTFMTSPPSSDASGSSQTPASGNGGKPFTFNMQSALQASSSKSSPMTQKPMTTNTASNEKGYKYYLESFKNKLLAQGKPLSDIFLKESDLPIVKKFLLQCGFSNEKADGFLKDLKTNSPDGQINLSYFFQKASELKSPKDKAYQEKIISSTAMPYIESILRNFQFTPKDMDNVFSAARVQGGGLDLDKFVAKLKEISTQIPGADKPVVDQNLGQQIMDKMEKIGIHIQNKEKIEHISSKDFIAALEQTSKNVNENDAPSSEIKKTLDALVNSVTHPDQNVSSASPVKISSNYNFMNSLIGGKTDKTPNPLFDKKEISSSEENNTNKDEAISSFLNQKGDEIIRHGTLDVNTSNVKARADIFSALNKKMGSMNPAEKANDHIQAKTGQMDAPRNTASFNLSGTVGTAESNDNGSTGYLQASLMEQVGKQVSKSILRGDRFVTLQLKPPDLGTVKIKMDMKDNTLRLAMTAEHHSVKELLLNNIHQLREALLQQGVKLDKVDVQIDYNFGQSLNGSKDGTNRGPGTRRDLDEKRINSIALAQGASSAPVNMISENNLLHLVA
jgi:flagellar hook-length control protein FliK